MTDVGQKLPTLDDILGPAPNAPPGAPAADSKLPTLDDILGAAPPDKTPYQPFRYGAVSDYGVASGPQYDDYVTNAPMGRILDAFGQGAKDGWGSEPLGLSDEHVKVLRKMGVFPDYEKGRTSLIKAINEGVMRPAAAGLEAFQRGLSAIGGGIVGATTEVSPTVGKSLETALEAATDPGLQATLAGTGPTGALAAGTLSLLRLDHVLAAARDLRVIGKGEAAWQGTQAEQEEARQAVLKRMAPSQSREVPPNEERIALEQPPEESAQPEAAAPAPAAAEPPPARTPTVDEIAREIAPNTFREWDALSARKDTYRRFLSDLDQERRASAETSAPQNEEIASLQAKLEDATPRLTKKYQARLDELNAARNQFIQEQTAGDSPDMAKVRAEFQKVDFRMRDMAPDVSRAYRFATERIGPQAEEAVPVPEAQPAESPAAPEAQAPVAPEPRASEEPVAPAPVQSEAAAPPTAIAAESPVPDGMVRMYSTAGTEADGSRWASPSLDYVRNHRPGQPVSYVDVPVDNPSLVEMTGAQPGDGITPEFGNSKLSPDIAAQMKPLLESGTRAATSIAADVSRQLVGAGRPEEEANAAAALVAAHYEARSANLKGTTPEQLYAEEGARIVGTKQKEMAFAQTKGREFGQDAVNFDAAKVANDNDAVAAQFKQMRDNVASAIDRFPQFPGYVAQVKKMVAYLDRVGPYGWSKQKYDAMIADLQKIGENIAKNTEAPGENVTSLTFKRWFGKSKVTDTNGKPLVVYHGTTADVEAFDKAKRGEATGAPSAREGFFFTASPEVASSYAVGDNPYQRGFIGFVNKLTGGFYEKANEALLRRTGTRSAIINGENVIPAYVSLKNPLEFDFKGQEYRERSFTDLIKEAKAGGHDGVIFRNTIDPGFEGGQSPSDVYVAFEPNQIKSVFNRGAFSPEDARILQQANRGKIAFRDGQAEITLFKTADASTFLHEAGHNWLEELMRDSADPRATDQARTDAATVRKWLGADETATGVTNAEPGRPTLTTRQHEKFARGFERYLMEGRAPTQALASVFEKFRQWLTSIYRTVAKLRAPITDDIRDVFDRLIAVKPEKPVVGPEPEDFAARHEDLAAQTVPEQAHPVAEQVRTESNAEAVRGNATDTLPPGTEIEGRGSPPEGEAPHGPGDEGRPAAGEAPAGEQAGAVRPGGTGVAPEGGPARGEPGTELEAGEPVGQVGPSPVVDKAGNIRFDNLNTTEEIQDALRQFANDSDEFAQARRGVVSDQQVLDFADAMGVDAKELNLKKLRQMSLEDGVPLAARIVAGRRMMVEAVMAAVQAADRAAYGSEVDIARYLEAKSRALMIAETISGITAEMGRGLRAFRMLPGAENDIQGLIEFMQSEVGKDPKRLRMEARAMSDAATRGGARAASKFARDSFKPGFWDMFIEYFVNNLISGPATHATYTVGNTILALTKAIPETAIQAGIGAFKEHVLGKDVPRVYFGEIGAQLKAMNRAGNPAITAYKIARLVQNAPDWATAKADAYALMRGSRDGVMAAARAAQDGTTAALPGEGAVKGMSTMVAPRNAIPNLEIGGVTVPVGTAIRLPSRGVAMIHSYFRAVGYEQNIARLAYRTATDEGLTGDAFDRRVADLTQNPTEDMMRDSVGQSTEQTLMGKGGPVTRALSMLSNARPFGIPIPKLINPFVHIVGNILEQGLEERSPLALADPELRENLLGKNGSIAQDIQLSRVIFGSMVGVTGFGLAMEGLQNGSGPSDPRQAALYRRVHGPANSTRIGDFWYDFHRLGPVVLPGVLAANIYETAHLMSQEDFTHAMADLSFAVSKTILDESGMRGPSDFIRAINDPTGFGARYVRSQMTSALIPYSVGMAQEAHAIDPNARRVTTMTEAFKAKVPWWSESLFPLRDVWGEPIPSREALGIDGLSAIYEEAARHDPVEQAMLRLHVYPAQPEKKIRGVELTEPQYDYFSMIAGRMLRMRLNAIVGQPGFTALPDITQHDMVVEAMRSTREAARSLVLMQNPDILRRAMQNKLAPLQAAH